MRVGQNPKRGQRAEKFADVVLCAVTHLPNMMGYHAQRFEVIQTCLRTMTERIHADYSLAIWDNGSCEEFRDWVQDVIRPDVFVKSFNAGKTAGRTSLARMIPPHKIVCYSDDDMYFYEDWFSPQKELLDHFPNVACVTGYPVRTQFRWGVENTLKWARESGDKFEFGKFVPQEWENDFCDSIGREKDFHAKYTEKDIDYRVTYKGKEAYLTSHHCQFIARSEIIGRVLTFDDWAMADEKPFDTAMDMLGLRLATTERLTRHIGNVLDENFKRLEQPMMLTEVEYAET